MEPVSAPAYDRPRVVQVPELSTMLGCSEWLIYQQVKAGEFPIPHIRVGRRIMFARARVDELLGISTGAA